MARCGVDVVQIERFAWLGGDEVAAHEARAGAEEWATMEAVAKCLETSVLLVDPAVIHVDGPVITLSGRLGERAAVLGVKEFRRHRWLAEGHVVVAVEAVEDAELLEATEAQT